MNYPRFFAGFAQDRIFGGAVVLALTQFGASLAGLIRDRVLTTTFPRLGVVDVYIASFRPSDLLFQVTIMAGFSVALVPLLARYKAENKPRQMSDLLSGVTGAAAIVFGLLALLLAVFFPWIAPHMTNFEGEALKLYIDFGRIALLTNFLFVFGNAFGQYLITIQKYWIYGLTPILYTLGTIFGALFLTESYGAYGPIFGTLGGAIIYVLLRLIALLRSNYRPGFMIWHPEIRELGWLMLPRMLALGALQLELLFFDKIASGLGSGAVTVNAYARNFQSVVIGVAGIALAQSAFSLLSQAAAKKEGKRFWIYVQKGSLILLGMTIPGAIALYYLAPVAADLVNLESELALFSAVLGIYAISIPFESLNHLLLRAFYAVKDTLVPAGLSALNGIVAIAIALILAPRYGVLSLAAAFTVGQIIQLIGLGILLPIRARNLRFRKNS
ncbi:MAG TPA: lipid II flippase MurJ [Candidatus Peribacteraceae bacterium]|nr:lipid II flippase MurJ [Candidatus Peribacteraceae bacterium]